jgi:hypothetical protein
MTRDDFTAQLEAYLDEYDASTPLPESVRDAVRAQLPTTKQIGPFPWPVRYPAVTNALPAPARYGLVAATAVAAVLLGASLFGTGNVGAPEPTPTPRDFQAQSTGPLDPGRYRLTSIPGVTIEFTVPDGWDQPAIEGGFNGPTGPETGVSFWTVDTLYADPCSADPTVGPTVGPTVDDLADALASMVNTEITQPPTDRSIGGTPGRSVAFTVPDSCEQFAPWPNPTNLVIAPGTEAEVWIAEVGSTRLVVFAHAWPDADADARAELDDVVESITVTSTP